MGPCRSPGRRKRKGLLFDDVERRPGPIDFRETNFQWLERCSEDDVEPRRRWIEAWFAELPCPVRLTFERRLRSRRFDQFASVLFEMQVHSLLRRLGCAVDIEPTLAHTRNRIDFRARSDDRTFYVEATVCGLGKSELRGNDAEDDAVRKIREEIPLLHSHLWLEATGELNRMLPKERVVAPFRALLEEYTPEDVRRRHGEGGMWNAPQARLTDGNWVLTGSLDPAPDGAAGHVVGPARGGAVDFSKSLREKLSDKARKWKNVDFGGSPFLVAVNDCSSLRNRSTESALFGRTTSDDAPREFRRTFSNVDGVLVVSNAVLGNEINAGVQLYRNGDAQIPACLRHLEQPHRLGELLGIAPRGAT